MATRIAADLFDFVDEARDELRGDGFLTQPLSATSAIRQFYFNFYAQFFENVLESDIVTISNRDAIRAGVLLKTNSKLGSETRALVRRFQKLCKMDMDLRGGDYGGGTHFYRAFHEYFVPELLEEVREWAIAEEAALAERVTQSAASYRSVLEVVMRELKP